LAEAEGERRRSGFLRYFAAARDIGLEPRVEEYLVALRPFYEHIERMDGLVPFFSDPTLADVQCLELAADACGYGLTGFGNSVATALAKAPHATSLLEVSFSGSGLSSKGVRALAASKALRRIRALGFTWEEVSPASFGALVRAFPSLEALSLNCCLPMDKVEECVSLLCQAVFAPRLRWLELSGNGVTDEALAALVDSPIIESLRALTVGRSQGPNRLTPRGLRTLVDSPLARSLVYLDLSSNALGREGLEVLAQSELPRMRALHLAAVTTGRAPLSIAPLLHATWPSLGRLSLADNRLSEREIAELAATRVFRGLTHLDLSANPIGDAGARRLCHADLSHLRQLRLSAIFGSEIAAAGWDALRASSLGAAAIERLRGPFSVPRGLAAIRRATSP
jgi:hypothetical protein